MFYLCADTGSFNHHNYDHLVFSLSTADIYYKLAAMVMS